VTLGAAAIVVIAVKAPKLQRSWFLYRLGRQISVAGVRPSLARFDALPYAPAKSTESGRAAVSRQYAALIGSAPDSEMRALAMLLAGQNETAVDLLGQADHKSGEAWNELAVALMQHALSHDDVEELVAALSDADRAVSIRGGSKEAVFNRALILDLLGLHRSAARGYRRVLELDDSSEWARETRHRLHDNSSVNAMDWVSARARLGHAAGDGDQNAVDGIVQRFPQQTRTFCEGVSLSDWADRVQAGAPNQAQPLAIARAVGLSLLRLSGEEFLSDSVAAIDHALNGRDERAINALAAGHVVYRKARILYGNEPRHITEALPLFAKAGGLFREGRSPMALLADYYYGSALFEQNASEEARARVRAIAVPQRYKALNALIAWFTATSTGNAGHFYESYRSYQSALDLYQNLAEEQNAMRMRTEIAFTLSLLGRSPEAWRMRRTIFQQASAIGDHLLIEKTISTAAFDAMRQKQWSEAGSLYRLITEAPEAGIERLRIDALLWGAYAESQAAFRDRSADQLRQAKEAIARLKDREMADAALHDENLVEGLITAKRDPKASISCLSAFIDYSDRHGKSFFVPEALLERSRAARAIGDSKLANSDLTRAVGIVEARRQQVVTVALRDTFSGTSTEIYDDLVDVQQSTGDVNGAFDTLERARARAILDRITSSIAIPIPLADLTREIKPGQTLVAYASLPQRLLIFVLRLGEFHCISQPIQRAQIEAAKSDLLRAIHVDQTSIIIQRSTEIYRWLIDPLAPYLAHSETLVIVPDVTLSSIPFSSLRSKDGQYLVEQIEILKAPSASVFNRTEHRTPQPKRTITAIGNPAFDRQALPSLELLPQAGAEASTVVRGYRAGSAIVGKAATIDRFFSETKKADVLHLATHALINAQDPWMSALVLAPGPRDSGLLYLNQIAGASFQNLDVAILAGCRTGVSASGAGAVRSLATAFLMGGARTVVGTLWDVDDLTTRAFSSRFHEELRAGAAPALALRRTQLSLLRDRSSSLRQPRTWAAFELLGSAR
jgi:CHAT domain-containing protein